MEKARLLIYVTSGTGNSLRVAHFIAARMAAGGQGPAWVVPIEEAQPFEEFEPGSGQIVGLVAPTHGFTTPWHMLRFACSLPRSRGHRAFVVVTRAGIKAGPIFLPGISATNMFLLALILRWKGFAVRGATGVDMPSNWYSLHPIQSLASQQAIITRAEAVVGRFSDRMLAGGRWWLSVANVLEGIMAVALFPIAFVYLFWGRFFLAKLFFANSRCNGCGICATSCPVGAIKMYGKTRPRPYWRFTCESCMRCGALCPARAVEAGHSWAVALYFITTLPLSLYTFFKINAAIPLARILESDALRLIFVLLGIMTATFTSYILFHLLNRLKPMNWLFAHTTLTHYWGRYREPGTSRRDLATGKNHEQ